MKNMLEMLKSQSNKKSHSRFTVADVQIANSKKVIVDGRLLTYHVCTFFQLKRNLATI